NEKKFDQSDQTDMIRAKTDRTQTNQELYTENIAPSPQETTCCVMRGRSSNSISPSCPLAIHGRSLPATQTQLHTSHAAEFRYIQPGCSGILPALVQQRLLKLHLAWAYQPHGALAA